MTNIVLGVESVEVALLNANGTIDASTWTRMEDIEEGSVTLTSTADTKTSITPEDKDSPIVVLFQPGDPDVYNFALLQISAENLARYFNVIYDAATSTVTILANKKHAKLALRMTSRPYDGVKKIYTFKNTLCDATWKNTITKTGLLAISVAASILTWKTSTNVDATMTIQQVLEDGTTIDSTPPIAVAPADKAVSGTSTSVTGTASATSPKTVVSQLWSKVSGASGDTIATPTALTTSITGLSPGVYVYRLTATDSNGDTGHDDITITVS